MDIEYKYNLSIYRHRGIMKRELQQLERQAVSESRGSIEEALKKIFPTQIDETRVQKVRRIMGSEIEVLSDEEVISYITEFQYLVSVWLDEYEIKAFSKTLNQLKRRAKWKHQK